MFKALYMMKRKPGMSFEDFIAHYEGVHAQLVDLVALKARKYVRKYLHPLDGIEKQFDVVVEIWFDSREDRDRSPALSDPAVMRRIAEDEKNLFDTASIVGFTYDERESVI